MADIIKSLLNKYVGEGKVIDPKQMEKEKEAEKKGWERIKEIYKVHRDDNGKIIRQRFGHLSVGYAPNKKAVIEKDGAKIK